MDVRLPVSHRALLVTDAGFLRTGLADVPLRSLRTAGIEVHVFSEVQADPAEAVVQVGVAMAQMFHVELIIGLGGGSSLDVAKLIAVLAPGHQELAQLYGIGNVHGQHLPLVQLPTTAGTGSEVTNIAIVIRGTTTKLGVVAPQLYAELAILLQPGITGSDEARANVLIDAMQDLALATGIARTLREVSIAASDLDRLADEAMLQTRLLGNNPRAVTRHDARAIYAAAL